MQQSEQPIVPAERHIGFVAQIPQQFSKLLHNRQIQQINRPFGGVCNAFFIQQLHQTNGFLVARIQHRNFLWIDIVLKQRCNLVYYRRRFMEAIFIYLNSRSIFCLGKGL